MISNYFNVFILLNGSFLKNVPKIVLFYMFFEGDHQLIQQSIPHGSCLRGKVSLLATMVFFLLMVGSLGLKATI